MIVRQTSLNIRQRIAAHKRCTCLLKRDFTARACERVVVPCHSNGSVSIDVYPPSNGLKNRETSPSVLLHLPRGSYLPSKEDDDSTIDILQSQLSCPIVRINYRLAADFKYPSPVHDVLAGYDWTVANLLPKRSIGRPGRSDHVGRVAICGELIGGGLATALALTECRVGEPGIVAAAVNNPLIDWISFDNSPTGPVKSTRKRGRKAQPVHDVDKLLSVRSEIFKRPGDYFDPFASPILFFRSAGVDVPWKSMTAYHNDMEHLSALEREEFLREEVPDISSGSIPTYDTDNGVERKQQRKASKRFPSKALDIRLPSFHVSAGSTSPLYSQSSELINVLRQSIARQSKHAPSSPHEFGRKMLVEGEEDEDAHGQQLMAHNLQQAEAEEGAQLTTYKGPGLWDSTANGKARVLEVAKWLDDRLR